jgi:hypothetical protein
MCKVKQRPPSVLPFSQRWGTYSSLLVVQRLEHSIRGVLVKLDADLRPELVGQVVKLPARRDRHEGWAQYGHNSER